MKQICAGISLLYLVIQFILIPQTIVTADEFVFARHILDYTQLMPYRDFLPYKSVLGHYLISLPLFFSPISLQSIFYIKDEIAIINAVCLFLATMWGARIFNIKAMLLATLAILANQFSMFYMSDLRVDMLSAWLCLFSAFSILTKKDQLGGILIGFAFLISQKALWYVIAINGGMLICWYVISTYSFHRIVTFNKWTAAVVGIYLITWSLLTSPAVVFSNFFYEAYLQAGIDYYLPIYGYYWRHMLNHGPILFLLWPLTLIPLLDKNINEQRLFSICFGAIAFILFVNYKQAFPYNFVFTLPAFFVAYSTLFSYAINAKMTQRQLAILIIYSIVIALFIYYLQLPRLNYLIVLLPIIFYSAPRIFYTIFIVVGVLYPFYLTYNVKTEFNGDYQQTMINLTTALTSDHTDYIAGVPMLFNQEQPVPGLKNLISLQISYLNAPNEKIKPLLLPSIYLTPTTLQSVLDDFEREPVKVFISNFRTMTLPAPIIRYVSDHYQHYYGSVYLYAPKVEANQLSFFIKFAGKYRVEGKANMNVKIDSQRKHVGKVVALEKGDHLSQANADYRLVLIPDVKMKLDARYQKDEWLKTL